MNRLSIAIALGLAGMAASISGAAEAPPVHHTVEGETLPWTNLDIRYAPRDFQFVVITDNTGTPRPGIWREAMEKINLLQPSFVMSVGDLIEGYVDTPEQLHAQWDEFMNDLAPLEAPFFFVAGNHDVGRPLWHQVYLERIGPSYYYFKYQDVLFLILDTNDSPTRGTGIGEEQAAWAEEVLARYPDDEVRWTFVFQHKPLWFEDRDEWNRLQDILVDRNATVFAGHIHNYMATEIEGIHFVTMATTGGGSPLRGKYYGEVDHIMWVTVTDEGPTMAALTLDGILSHDFRTPELAEKLMPFRENRAVRVPPLQAPDGVFEQGDTTASIVNPAPWPLRFQALFEPQEGIVVRPAAISEMLEPGETLEVTLSIDADAPIPAPVLQPIVMHWSAVYDFDSEPAIKLNGKSRIFVDAPHPIPYKEGITVDGDLDDWDELPFLVKQPGEVFTNEQAWRGPHDAHFRFGIAHDDEFVYVAIHVIDDEVSTEGVMIWQDFAGLYVNPLIGPGATPEGVRDAMFTLIDGDTMTREDRERYFVGQAPEAAQTAVSAGEGELLYEFAIPIAHLEAVQGGSWQGLQMNIVVNDYDPSDERLGVSAMFWRPRWDSGQHYPASGLFLRSEE